MLSWCATCTGFRKGAVIDRFPSQNVTSARPIGVSLLQALSFVYTYFFRFAWGLRTCIVRSCGEPQLTVLECNCSPQGGIEYEIRTVPGPGSFTAHPVGRRLLGFSRCKWLNSHLPAVRHHFGSRALLYRRHANRLEMREDGFFLFRIERCFAPGPPDAVSARRWRKNPQAPSSSFGIARFVRNDPYRLGLLFPHPFERGGYLRIFRAAVCVLACCYCFLHLILSPVH